MLAAFHLGRCLNKRQRVALGFTKGVTPCHATLTETLRAIDGRALAQALGAACCAEGEDQRHIAIDSKTMRASKDGDGNATHVLSAYCAGLQSILGNEASRGKGMGIPDALKLLDQLDLKDKIVTGDAMFCKNRSGLLCLRILLVAGFSNRAEVSVSFCSRRRFAAAARPRLKSHFLGGRNGGKYSSMGLRRD